MSANPSTDSHPSRPVLKNTYGRKLHTDPSLETSEDAPTPRPALSSRISIIDDDEDNFYSDLAMSRSLLAPKPKPNASALQNLDATQLISYPDENKTMNEDNMEEELEAPLTPRSKLRAQLASLESAQSRHSMEPKTTKASSTNLFTLIGDDEDEEEENDEAFMSRFRTQFLSKQASAPEPASESVASTVEIQNQVPARVTTPTRLSPENHKLEPSPIIRKPLPVLQRDLDEISDEDEHITDLSDNEDYLFMATSGPRTQAPKILDAENESGMEVNVESQSVMELEPELPVSSTPAAKPKKVSLLCIVVSCYTIHLTNL